MNHFYKNPIVTTCRGDIKTTATRICAVFVLFLSFIVSSSAQIVPQLTFQNPQLISGTDKADGAVYRFSNVTTGIDALFTIVGRSDANPGGVNPTNYVELSEVDMTFSGSNNAFQPRVTFIGNNANKDWWIDFNIHFVAAGTTDELPAGSSIIYKAAIFDIDGDNNSVREYNQSFGATSYQTNPGTALTVSSVSRVYGSTSYSGTEFLGALTDYSEIDVNASDVSATLSYVNQNSIYFRVGGRNSGSSSGDGDRLNSILIKDFLYVAPGSTLPVDLTSFTAKLNKTTSVLDWATANEINFSHFIIQRSTNGSSFTDIGTVTGKQSAGSASTSYTFSDNISAVQSTIVYYRLKMVDQDASFKYSDIEIVRKSDGQDQASILVYPNPVISELRVTIPDSWQGKTVSYVIYNGSGSIVQQKLSNNAGQTEIFSLSGSPAGLYVVKVTKDGETIVKQLIKQ